MALNNTNLLIQMAQLPAVFKGSPQELAVEMVRRMKIVSPSSVTFIFVGDSEPSGNVGPWLKNGTSWWVFDPNLKRYVPLDISASETKWYQVGSTTPTTSNPPLWLKTTQNTTEPGPDEGTPVSWNQFNGTEWVQFPVAIPARSTTRDQLFWTANFFGTASGTDSYTLNFSPGTDFTLGDGVASTFAFYVKFANANTAAMTLNVNGTGAKPVKKFTTEDLVAGEIVAGSIHLLTFDGTNFQLLSDVNVVQADAVLQVVGTVDDTVESTALTFPYDNTVPQITEGAPVNGLDTPFTAKQATSKLIVDVEVSATSGGDTVLILALFRDSESNALAVSAVASGSDNRKTPLRLRAILDNPDTAAHTYRVRYGSASAAPATMTLNDAALFGSTLQSTLSITEISQ